MHTESENRCNQQRVVCVCLQSLCIYTFFPICEHRHARCSVKYHFLCLFFPCSCGTVLLHIQASYLFATAHSKRDRRNNKDICAHGLATDIFFLNANSNKRCRTAPQAPGTNSRTHTTQVDTPPGSCLSMALAPDSLSGEVYQDPIGQRSTSWGTASE